MSQPIRKTERNFNNVFQKLSDKVSLSDTIPSLLAACFRFEACVACPRSICATARPRVQFTSQASRALPDCGWIRTNETSLPSNHSGCSLSGSLRQPRCLAFQSPCENRYPGRCKRGYRQDNPRLLGIKDKPHSTLEVSIQVRANKRSFRGYNPDSRLHVAP